MPRFVVHTLGCKVNQYESQALAALLQRTGLCPAQDGASADLVVVNTCCVTSRAAAKSRQAIRRAVRTHARANVLILGCYATQDGATLRQAAVDSGCKGRIHVAGHGDDVADCARSFAASLGRHDFSGGRKARAASETMEKPGRHNGGGQTSLPSTAGRVRNEECMRARPSTPPAAIGPGHLYNSITPHSPARVKDNFGTADLPPIRQFAGHARAFVKVQDGCDAFCSYCIVPHLRRRLWWRPADEIVREARTLVANGHKEIVLCGVFLGAYGQATAVRRRWTAPPALPELLRQVAGIAGLWRVRLSSLDVGDVNDELLNVFADCPTVAAHLHLPLQAGSARILRRMNRQYSPRQFVQTIRRIKRRLELPAVTTDVLVGFPGETEDDFAHTLTVAEQADFSKVHIFPFSARPGTAAWKWRAEDPPAAVIQQRCARLAELARQTGLTYRRRFIGRTVEVLTELPGAATPPDCARGLTDRYLQVTFPADRPTELAGQVLPIRIAAASAAGLTGTAVSP